MCSRSFGKVLVDHLEKHKRQHIDHSWQKLWGDYKVYISRPQLFVQRAGFSNQNDVEYRDENSPLDWSHVLSLHHL